MKTLIYFVLWFVLIIIAKQIPGYPHESNFLRFTIGAVVMIISIAVVDAFSGRVGLTK